MLKTNKLCYFSVHSLENIWTILNMSNLYANLTSRAYRIVCIIYDHYEILVVPLSVVIHGPLVWLICACLSSMNQNNEL